MKPLMRIRSKLSGQGLTLIELVIVLAVVALAITLAAPSFREMIQMQRLRGINAQLVTDMQFARSEAVALGKTGRVSFGASATQTCYVIYTAPGNGTPCNCTRTPGDVCSSPALANSQEIRTVSVPLNSGVTLSWPSAQDAAFGYDHVTGGLVSIPTDTASAPLVSVQISARIDDDRQLRNTILQTGRPTVCAPNATRMQVTAC